MKNIVAFAASNSKQSINKQLVEYTASLLNDASIDILDLNNFDLPIYSIDLEIEKGIPQNAHNFLIKLKDADGILISFAEHNGTYTTVFKNLFDWMTRIESKTFFNKPMLLMATSPGGRGGASVLEAAVTRFPYHDAKIAATFSLPFFGNNFKDGEVVNEELNQKLLKAVEDFKNNL